MNPSLRFILTSMLVSVLLAGLSSLLLWLLPVATAGTAASNVAVLDPTVIKWGYLTATLATGISVVAAAYTVTHVGAAAIGSLTEKPELFGRLVILVGLAEGIAIYGLIVAVLILNHLG